MEKKEISDAVRTLSLAMLGNPIHAAVYQDLGDEMRHELERMFDILLRELPGVTFLGKMKNQTVGVLRMKSCEGRRTSTRETDEDVPTDTFSRVSHWRNVWALHDPPEPHWHLGPVGVLPSHQGIGFGTQLMRRFCQEVDACKSAAYLETDLPENVLFYQKFDFQVVKEADIFGVKNFFMWRSPRLQSHL